MSNSSRNRRIRKKSDKNTNNSDDSQSFSKSHRNPASKSAKSRNMRPGKSRGIKTHADVATPKPPNGQNRRQNLSKGGQNNWIWGHHAALAALENPKRTIHRILASPKLAERLELGRIAQSKKTDLQILTPAEMDRHLPENTAHQGLAVACAPLSPNYLDEISSPAKGLIIVLDQITDPHNVGAIFRLARAFSARAIVMQSRHAPPLFGATAKVAVGNIETVPAVLVTNIANALLDLQNSGWRVTGLAGEADIDLETAFTNAEAEVVVMGAEGPGLRKRVRDCCDQLAKIPMPGGAESLNVSTAAGIALYEATRNAK